MRKPVFVAAMMAMSGLGVLLGQLVSAKPAAACSCAAPSWNVTLTAYQGTDPNSSSAGFWPNAGRLSVLSSDWVTIDSYDEGSVVDRLQATP